MDYLLACEVLLMELTVKRVKDHFKDILGTLRLVGMILVPDFSDEA